MNVAIRALLAIALSWLPRASHADLLVAASGDRLQGRYICEHGGVIIFDSELLGRIEVRTAQAKVQPAQRQEICEFAKTSGVVPLAPAAGPRLPLLRWTSDLGARLSVDRGSLKKAEDDFRVSVKSNRPTRRGELVAGIEYRHKRNGEDLKYDDWRIAAGYDRFINERKFLAGRLLAVRELTSEGYDETHTALVAAGWRFRESKDRHFRIGPALGLLSITRGSERLDSPALGFYAATKGRGWAGVRFSSELQFLDTMGDGRYAYLELRLRHPLGERLYLALVWDYAWSDFDLETGVKSEWRWDFGWRFGPGERD